jgi:aminoglycoside phosphotransferase family enzyme
MSMLDPSELARETAELEATARVQALCLPSTYPGLVREVEAIETHRSWVFLTDIHAYKLNKPAATQLLGATELEERKRASAHELELNRRLAPDVYLGVVPLTRSDTGALRIGGAGPALNWLIQMRRLPRERMLDTCISRGTVIPREVDALATTLTRFYACSAHAGWSGDQYRERLTRDIDAKSASLQQDHYGLDRRSIIAAVSAQRAWLEHDAALLEVRASAVLDAHGDLRPEHVCLEQEPVVIDCLEFDRELRLLDPLSELAYLALECQRLGAPWIGEHLLVRYRALTGDDAPRQLDRFYQSYHALVRAAVAIWHLDDPHQTRAATWRARAERYLHLAVEALPGAAVS